MEFSFSKSVNASLPPLASPSSVRSSGYQPTQAGVHNMMMTVKSPIYSQMAGMNVQRASDTESNHSLCSSRRIWQTATLTTCGLASGLARQFPCSCFVHATMRMPPAWGYLWRARLPLFFRTLGCRTISPCMPYICLCFLRALGTTTSTIHSTSSSRSDASSRSPASPPWPSSTITLAFASLFFPCVFCVSALFLSLALCVSACVRACVRACLKRVIIS